MKFSPLLSIFLLFLFIPMLSWAQIITTDPAIPLSDGSVIIYYDATLGTGGLKGYTGDVYAHAGVLTNLSTGSGACIF